MKKRIEQIQKTHSVIGRDHEIANLIYCVDAGKNVLLEGPVGVGKTYLVNAVAEELGKSIVRVDGDSRYTEQKLTGWFDPPTVLKKGYVKESFFVGPLVKAMKDGAILFINELNRMPEGVQNILLPAMDERQINVPRIGMVKAKTGFLVLATQNPKEFVATTHISEALLDRFELIRLNYQDQSEELAILKARKTFNKGDDDLLQSALTIVRQTRTSPLFKRGASIRAAMSIFDIAKGMGGGAAGLEQACLMALPTRVELSDEGLGQGEEQAIKEILFDSKKKD